MGKSLIWAHSSPESFVDMPRLKLTEKALAKIKAPDPSGAPILHLGHRAEGLCILCSGVSDARTFVAQRDLINGRARRVTIGAVNEIPLAAQGAPATDVLDDLRRGLRSQGQESHPNATLDARELLSRAQRFTARQQKS